MKDSSARASSELLLRSWRDGTVIDALPTHLRPATRADGYAIQAHLERAGAGALRGGRSTSSASRRLPACPRFVYARGAKARRTSWPASFPRA
ncbi:MAG: hypothetical protein ACKOGH_11755 [Alphaproteobacteria bacterium]